MYTICTGKRSTYTAINDSTESDTNTDLDESDNEYSTTSEDETIETASDIESDTDTDNEIDGYIQLYDMENDYNTNFSYKYVDRLPDGTSIDYIHLSLHSWGFNVYL